MKQIQIRFISLISEKKFEAKRAHPTLGELFPPRESLVSDIPADGTVANLLYTLNTVNSECGPAIVKIGCAKMTRPESLYYSLWILVSGVGTGASYVSYHQVFLLGRMLERNITNCHNSENNAINQ